MCDPVTVGVAVAKSYGVAAGMAAGASVGAAWGVGINAATNIATGQGAFDNWGRAAAFGALSGGIGTYAAPYASFIGPMQTSLGEIGRNVAGYAVTGGSALSIGLSSAAGSIMNMPQQDYSQYYNQLAGSDPIAYNTQQSVVTGSGGRQASANLAEEIKRAKTRRAAQADVGNIDLATSLSNTGLQIA